MSWAAVLLLANVLADVVIGSPLLILPQLMEQLNTDQPAWLSAGAMLAGAIWSPMLARGADVFGARRTLCATLVLSAVGALTCLVASHVSVFLAGRFLQGAAFASVFLTVALTRQICTPQTAMALIGVLTSGASVIGILEPVLMTAVIDRYGYRSVFGVAALLAGTAAVSVRCFVPESPIRAGGRVDVAGGLLLGGGLGAVLAYVSVGSGPGWLSTASMALLAGGALMLAAWVARSLRVADPIIDIRALRGPLLLTLAALVLAAGAFRSMLQLISVVAHVPGELGLRYGLGDETAVAVLFGVANCGIALGGVGAGWVAARRTPALPLLGGIAVGTVATFTMLAGIADFRIAVVCGALIGVAAGAVGASGYNLATSLEPPERQGVSAGLVSVVLALGSVVVSFAGGEVLKASRIHGVSADGSPVSSMTGICAYVVLCGVLFGLAALPALRLVRSR
ncbi:MFS transporter [Mycolicibacterium vaccae]|uniref:MFS transporter n=1 Tax=Mycolicibacterium vaccae TaxID=1810 RepID=UPI003CE80730